MIRTSGWLNVVAIMVLSTGVVMADEKPENGRKPGQGERPRLQGLMEQRGGAGRPDPGMLMARSPLMVALDADGDGALSASEIENASKALAKLDKDGDGELSQVELRPDPASMGREGGGRPGGPMPGGAMSKEMMQQMFKRQDADGDGKLSGDEIPERMKQLVSRADQDGDGALSESEIQSAMSRFQERGGLRGVRGENEGKDGSGVQPKRPPVE